LRISLQDDNGVELNHLDGIGEGTYGLEIVNPATGSVRLTHDTTLALAKMFHSAGVRPGGTEAPKPKNNIRSFERPNK
jgi:hypothetical protein